MGKKLALVVHGIGEQKEGDTVSEMVGGLIGDRDQFQITTDRLIMQDKHEHAEMQCAKLFPVHIHRVKPKDNKASETVFAEVFWADLSSVGEGRFGIITDFLKMVLGLSHIARANRDEFYPPKSESADVTKQATMAPLVRFFSEGFIHVFHGGVVPVNFVALFLFLTIYAVSMLFGKSFGADLGNAGWVDWSIIITGIFCFIATRVFRPKLVGRLLGHTYAGFKILGSGLIIWGLVQWLGIWRLETGMIDQYVFDSAKGFRFCGQLALNTDNSAALFERQCEVAQLAVAVPLLIAAFSVVALALLFLSTCCHLFELWILKQREAQHLTSQHSLFNPAGALLLVLFTSAVVPIWVGFLTMFENLPEAGLLTAWHIGGLSSITVMGAMGVWAALVVLIICALIVEVRRRNWDDINHGEDGWSRVTSELRPKMTNIPRLIIGHPIRIGLLVGLVLIVALATISSTNADHIVATAFGYSDYPQSNYPFWVESSAGLSTSIALAIAALFGVFSKFLGAGVGIGKDVVGYFTETYNPKFGGFQRINRARFNGRFEQVLTRLWRSEGDFEELIIVSHSQGTVVAVENVKKLASSALQAEDNILSKTRLLTMGSPVTHLYHTYFPFNFNGKAARVLEGMQEIGMKGWRNIYRSDDYVGTFINQPDGNWPINFVINRKGHIGYWYDGIVREIVLSEKFQEFRHVSPSTTSQ